MISPTDIRGLRLAYGSWKTTWMSCAGSSSSCPTAMWYVLSPAFFCAAFGMSKISSPLNFTAPDVGGEQAAA